MAGRRLGRVSEVRGQVLRTPLLLAVLLARVAFAAPVVLWASDPVRPGEAALVFGDGFESTEVVYVVRWVDEEPQEPDDLADTGPRSGPKVRPLQPRQRSIKFVIPGSFRPGVFTCRIVTAEGSAAVLLNRPHAIWLHGDAGPEATPGGYVRVFGRCLAMPGRKPLVLLCGRPVDLRLSPEEPDEWSLRARLPADIKPGRYELYVHNGCGGDAAWSGPLELVVKEPDPWPATVFNVRDFGAKADGAQDDTLAVRAALEKARADGGGVVYFPRGRYQLSEGIDIPPRTVLRGEARELVAIFWPDLPDPPEFLIYGGKSFAVEDLTFYCTSYVHFLGNDIKDPDAGDVHIRRIRVRAVLYRGHLKPDEVSERFTRSLRLSTGGGDTLRLRGSNIEVEGCDLYGSGRAFFLLRGRGARIRRNTLYNGRWGWYCISGADGVVFEENELTGTDLMSTGGGINCLYGVSWSQNVFYARNRLARMHGWDREAMTSDAGGGAYCGPVTSAAPRSVTLADEANWRKKDWTGAAVFVLDGRGTGQYRRIVGWEGRRVEVDEPWKIVPDDTSTVSVTMLQRNYYFIGNEFSDAGVAIQLYGMAIGHVMAGNRSTRTGGFHNFGMSYHGIQPSWYNQWLGNEILEGNIYQGGHNQHKLSAPAHLGVFAFPPRADWSHPLTLCTIVRRNRLRNNAHIAIGGTDPDNSRIREPAVQDVIVENNHVANSDVGIWLRRAADGVLLRGNTFENVAEPVLDSKEIERRLAAKRAKLLKQRGPVACWSFDEARGAVAHDDSGNGFLARARGAVRFEPQGVSGQCAVFDGRSELRVSNGRLLHLKRFTVAAWIRPETVEGRSGIIAKRVGNVAAPFVLNVTEGRIGFEACDESGRTWTFNFLSPPLVKAGEWQHVAAVVKEGEGVTLYLDGSAVASKANTRELWQNDDDLWIGRDAWGGRPPEPGTPGFFCGAIDEVKIWSRALGERELRSEVERARPPKQHRD